MVFALLVLALVKYPTVIVQRKITCRKVQVSLLVLDWKETNRVFLLLTC